MQYSRRVDAFENVVCEILRADGYWVQSAYKVALTKEEKREIDRPSCPRWELDVVAYRAGSNELLVVECKSYLDSPGVSYKAFDGSGHKDANRYKLFNEDTLRRVVLDRLVAQMIEARLVAKDPSVRLVLVAGKIISDEDRDLLRAHFDERGWMLWDRDWLCSRLKEMSAGGYEDSSVAVTAKLLLR